MDAKKISLIIAVAVILAAGVWYYSGSGDRPGKTAGSNRSDNGEPTNSFRFGANAIYVSDQMPGREVLVGFTALGEPGFVVIHELDNGAFGEIVGVSELLSVGESGNIPPIILKRGALHGETFVAVLHRDGGDGVFDPTKDDPVTDGDDEPFAMQFMIDRDAAEAGEVNL